MIEMEDGKINVKNIEQVLEVICRIIYKLLKVLFQGVHNRKVVGNI